MSERNIVEEFYVTRTNSLKPGFEVHFLTFSKPFEAGRRRKLTRCFKEFNIYLLYLLYWCMTFVDLFEFCNRKASKLRSIRNRTKRNETKWRITKRNEIQRNETKNEETKRNEIKYHKTKRNIRFFIFRFVSLYFVSLLHFSFRFVSFRFVSFSFLSLVVPLTDFNLLS
jgi:hypothetical protein